MDLQNHPEFRLLLEHTPVAVALFDREMRYIATSRRWLTDYGVNQQSLIGRHYDEVFPPTPEKWKIIHQRCLGGSVESCEADSFVRDDGSIGWVKWESRPWYDYNGDIGGIVLFTEVIPECKFNKEIFQGSVARFHKLAANVPGMIYQLVLTTDDTQYFSYISPGCRELFELEPEEIQQDIGAIFNLIHPDDYSEFEQSILVSAKTLQPFNQQYRIITPSGKLKWVQAQSQPEQQANGDVVWYGLVMDITDRKLAEEALQQLEQTVEELNRTQTQLVQSEKMSSLGQLVAGVAHEINNPVNFIYGNLAHATEYTRDILGLLKLYQQAYPQSTPEIREEMDAIDLDFLVSDLPNLLSSMKVGADRIRGIVRSLRSFSRHDEAEMKEVDIHEGIDSTLMILQNRLKTKPDSPEIQLIKNYGKLPLVQCYAGQLNQVFMNLLVNAIDALQEGVGTRQSPTPYSLLGLKPQANPTPQIEICTQVLENNQIAILIADNGPGMKPEVKKRLFDPFFTTKPIGVGTGLGLSISYQIVVEKHGGQLYCFSEEGQGTKFVIEIPGYQNLDEPG
ncbi:MAG: PAS domain-containing protein [Stigonema ocellatum SAG 48.90 = DSM 106950]|nr:PAS domain-containing protein [Stigonema ocellatum SAG 48.90 = DSM 106950]